MLVSDIIETSFGPIFTNYLFNALVILGVKSAHIRSYSGPYFPAFGLNMERHSVSLRIQSEYGKIQTRITPNTGTFYAVIVSLLLISIHPPWDILEINVFFLILLYLRFLSEHAVLLSCSKKALIYFGSKAL